MDCIRAAALLASALLVAGCSTTPPGSLADQPVTTASLGEPSIKDTARAAQAWQQDRGDKRNGLAYARGLISLQRDDEAVKVIEELVRRHPDDLDLAAYLGRILVQSGRIEDGERHLRRAIAGGKTDWRIHSALGSALDQQGRHPEARAAYQAALAEKPDQVSVLNNLGLSYALDGDLKSAEQELRRASALPAAEDNSQLRQNLALVVGLEGRFDDAKQIASHDLPPDQVEANIAFLKRMLSEANPWEKLKN